MNLPSPQGGSFQQQVLWRFTALTLLRPEWAGELVLGCGLGDDGAFALASHIAGAVCLSIEPDVRRLKAAQRSGACDFAVNTLDEALRTMKNEVRKGRALSVGLKGEIGPTLNEIVERGLLPVMAWCDDIDPAPEALERLHTVGTRILEFGEADVAELMEDWARRGEFALRCIPAGNLSELKELDHTLQQITSEEDRLRWRWLEQAPKHFQREKPLGRVMWLRDGESVSSLS